jgi:hypothetical protein
LFALDLVQIAAQRHVAWLPTSPQTPKKTRSNYEPRQASLGTLGMSQKTDSGRRSKGRAVGGARVSLRDKPTSDGRHLLIRGTPFKTIVAPLLATTAMVNEEKAIRIIFRLDRS